MTISARLEFSHKYSFNSPIRGTFKLTVVPEMLSVASGFHYIILLDTSGSMRGEKIETAKRGAIELLNRIPQGNKVTLITFSSYVNTLFEFEERKDLVIENIQRIYAKGYTAFHTALTTAVQIAKKYNVPGYFILLTDGRPTDRKDIQAYEMLDFPREFKVIAYGIGYDYEERFLKIIADKTGGIFIHIQDPKEIINSLPQAAVTKIGAKDVVIDIDAPSSIRLLNYPGPPVILNAIDKTVTIYGETTIPARFNGNALVVTISYVDPLDNLKKNITLQAQVYPATDTQMFLSSINNEINNEYQYYELMNKLADQVNSENLIEATKTLNQMQQIAQQTKRVDLIETTRKLQQSIGSTRNVEQTRKTIMSEVTKKMRS